MLSDRKARALMIVIRKIIAKHDLGQVDLDSETFKLFEAAKIIYRAKNERDFRVAVAKL
jgi:hypothetical protein